MLMQKKWHKNCKPSALLTPFLKKDFSNGADKASESTFGGFIKNPMPRCAAFEADFFDSLWLCERSEQNAS